MSKQTAKEKLLWHLAEFGKDRQWDELSRLFLGKKTTDLEWARNIARHNQKKIGEYQQQLQQSPASSHETLCIRIRSQFGPKKPDVYTLEDMAANVGCSVTKLRKAIDSLISEGWNFKVNNGYVLYAKEIDRSGSTLLQAPLTPGGWYRFGVVGDNHLGSRYERLDVLNSLYNRFEQEGITTVFNTGNWVDGEARFNKHDLHVHGMDRQIDYFLQNYPRRKSICTHYITGDDHEGWWSQREGINVGKYTEQRALDAGRDDLKFLGHMEADVVLKAPKGRTVIRVQHPGGGSAYAISYTSQKIVESYTGSEKPHILLIGHYHKADYSYIRGVHVVQTGCTQDQTPFMRKKRLAAHLGGWIIEFSVDEQGAITRFKQEFMPYYDNSYHKQWGYQW